MRPRFALPAVVFVVVLALQLWLVARAGTDIPFYDQWDAEGRTLYPAWIEGTWRFGDLFHAHNEHRIAWTRALDLALFEVNGQWDPLVQMAAGALIRALAAAGLAWALLIASEGRARMGLAVEMGVVVAFLPHLGWHNVLWGFQSQVYFSLLFSLAALWCLAGTEVAWRRQIMGLLCGLAGLVAMGSAALVPVALLGLVGLRAVEARAWTRARTREAWPALALLIAALLLRADAPQHAALRASSPIQWGEAFLRALAWPHTGMPAAAFALNAPLVWCVTARLLGRRRPTEGEDFVTLLGGWAVAMAAAMAWSRGASGEFAGAIPSRYVDFLVLLPLANAWCAVALWRDAAPVRRRFTTVVVAAWAVFLLVGWGGLSTQMMQRILLPRMRDRDAPVRLAVAFQKTRDASVFAGQPALLVPSPNPGSVRIVLDDPRMRGSLPPSLQPDRPPGPLSRAVRWLLGR